MGTVTQYNMANIRDALGGSNPVSLSQYYRGGPRVPSTRTVTVRDPSSGEYYNLGSTYWYQLRTSDGGPITANVYWFGTLIGSLDGEPTSFTSGGFTYFRGSFRQRFTTDLFYSFLFEDYYGVFRTSTSTASINTGVPSSGQISISQLFGAENP
jgi:hypothetical protein